MKRQIVCVAAGGALLLPCLIRADFKYTENTKFTGGAMAGFVKFAARVGGKGDGSDSSTYYIKGNRMRVEGSDGEVQIIDLDGRQITTIDPKQKTYGIVTFTEMRGQLEQLRQLRGHKNQPTVSPKVQFSSTQNTRTLLGHTAHGIQARVESRVSDGNSSGSAATIIQNDSWVASTVPGYEEVRNFHKRMARELNWAPGEIGSDPHMKEAMEAMRNNSPLLSGFPLLSFVKMTGSLSGARRSHSNSDSLIDDTPTSVPTSNGDAVNEALGGLLGLHKRKRDAKGQASSSSESLESSENGS